MMAFDSVLSVGNPMNNSLKIRHEAAWRDIRYLLHFTPIENLTGIVTNGFLSRADLKERGLDAYGSPHRLDREDRAISVSISAVYPKMFKAKQQAAGHPRWVILLLDASILWTHRCRFLRRNGGKRAVLNHTGYLGGPWGFSQMFSGEDRPSGIPDRLTTYPDAEVQVFDPISAEMILEAWVDRPELADAVQAELNRLPGMERNVIRCSSWPVFRNGYREWIMPMPSREWKAT